MFSIPQIYDKHFEWPNMVGENNGGYFFLITPPQRYGESFNYTSCGLSIFAVT